MTNSTETQQTFDLAWVQRALAIASLVLAILAPVVGLVASIISFVWAKRTDTSATLPLWGMIVSVVMLILTVTLGIIAFFMFSNAVNAGALDIEALCAHRSQWGWLLDSLRYVCR